MSAIAVTVRGLRGLRVRSADTSASGHTFAPVDAQFARVYGDHVRAIHRYFARRLGTDLADDLTADTFTAALGAWHRFDPEQGDVLPWLYGIAANIASSHRRRQAKHLRALTHRGLAPMDEVGPEEDVVERLTAASDAAIAARAVMKLPDFDREALLMLAWDGLTYAQIAAALDSTVTHVRSRLHEARQRLRAALAAGDEEPQ